MEILISIIIPTFNSAGTLQQCLESIGNQTFKGVEIVVIDGGSRDDTPNIVQSFVQKTHAKVSWLSEKDEGIYDAMNKGIGRAGGDWLYFLGSDDYLAGDQVLQNVVDHIRKSPSHDIVYGNVFFRHAKKVYDGKFSAYKLMRKNICHQAIFYKKKVFEVLGGYETRYIVYADYVFNIKAMHRFRTKYIDLVVADYNEGGYSIQNVHKDLHYYQDRISLNKKYFKPQVRLLYKFRNVPLVKWFIEKRYTSEIQD